MISESFASGKIIREPVGFDNRYWAGAPGVYYGCASHAENYEEKTGLAVSSDLCRWECLSQSGPILTSPHRSGSLRYIDAQLTNGPGATTPSLSIFYEFARPDSAHDLRFVDLPVESLFATQDRAL